MAVRVVDRRRYGAGARATATHGLSPGGTAPSTRGPRGAAARSGAFGSAVHGEVGTAEPAEDVVDHADVLGQRPVGAPSYDVVHSGADLGAVGGAGDSGLGDQAAQR